MVVDSRMEAEEAMGEYTDRDGREGERENERNASNSPRSIHMLFGGRIHTDVQTAYMQYYM